MLLNFSISKTKKILESICNETWEEWIINREPFREAEHVIQDRSIVWFVFQGDGNLRLQTHGKQMIGRGVHFLWRRSFKRKIILGLSSCNLPNK